MEDVLNIPGSIHSISQEGNAVYADEVFDKRKNKKQQLVNQETDEELANHGQRIGTLEEAVGEGGSVDERIAQAKSEAESEIKGGASSDYDTMKKTEDAIKAEVNARDGAVSDEASARQDAINTAKTEIIGGASTDCNTLGKAEIKISTNAQGIAQLQAAYEALTESDVVVVAPTDTWPVANPQQNTIYRVADRVNPTPQYYEDYMYNGTAMVLMARYNNAIDPRPKKGSQNLVSSGGVFDNMGALDVSELNATENPHTLATYADLSAALATIPSDYQKGGMSVKFVCSSDNKYVQFRCKTQSFSAEPEDWYFEDDCTLVENPEYIKVITDANGRTFGWIRKKDGGIDWVVGVPKPVKAYVDACVEGILKGTDGTTIDGLNKVIAFLDEFSTSDTLAALLDTKVDKVAGKSLIDENVSLRLSYVENNEFKKAVLDENKKVLGGRKANGILFENVGLELKPMLMTSINSPEWDKVIIDSDKRIILGIKKNGKVFVGDLNSKNSDYTHQSWLYGKTWVALGDSITAFKKYTNPLSAIFNLKLTNVAVGGAKWQNYNDGTSKVSFKDLVIPEDTNSPSNVIMNQVYRLLRKATPVDDIVPEIDENTEFADGYSYPVYGLGEMKRDDVDLITIAAGVNDRWSGGELGDVLTFSNIDYQDCDKRILVGAMKWACIVLAKYFPNANIVILAPIQVGVGDGTDADNQKLYSIVNKEVEFGKYYGFPVMNMHEVVPINRYIDTTTYHKYLEDGLHPNAVGGTLMANSIASYLESILHYSFRKV